MGTAIDFEALVGDRILESIDLKRDMLNDIAWQLLVARAGGALLQVFREGGKALFFGNGGSAADAQHLAAELTGHFQLNRRALPALALNANTSSLTAIANDYSFEHVFARQVESLGLRGDAAIGITTSGRSRNVIRALATARNQGMLTIALTGKQGESLTSMVDYCLCIPSEQTARIQEAHILTGHILCEIIEQGLLSESSCVS